MLWNVCSVRPARAPRALRAPTSRCRARPPDAPWRRPTDQTCTLESPANGSRRMQSGRSERQHRPASQLPHECRSAGRTMDATDTAAPKTRYRGRSQALLYNTIRPHASLGFKPPAPEVFVPARRVAGCATPSGSAGHAGETAILKLTFHLAHSAGADHSVAEKSVLIAYCAHARPPSPSSEFWWQRIALACMSRHACEAPSSWRFII